MDCRLGAGLASGKDCADLQIQSVVSEQWSLSRELDRGQSFQVMVPHKVRVFYVDLLVALC